MPQHPDLVELDLNNPAFQQALFALSKDEQHGVLATLRKLSRMTWEQVYRDKGLRWEAILSREGPDGRRLYSLRISRVCRAIAFRDGPGLRMLSIHPDHDSAYRP
jgi:hypothetical protein